MNKRLIWALVLIVTLVVVFVFFYYFKKQPASYKMTGQVTEVKSDSIVVKGTVEVLVESQLSTKENRTIEFVITPETVFNKTAYIIPKNIKNGVTFTPETVKSFGAKSDLTPGLAVQLESRDNLFDLDNASILNINYEILQRQK